jgi:NitT/TauT family transport system permease protein
MSRPDPTLVQPSPWPKIILRTTFLLSLLVVWELGVRISKVPVYLLPPPFGFHFADGSFRLGDQSVAAAFIHMIRDGSLWDSVRNSMGRMVLGYSVSVVFGVILGILLARIWFLQQTVGSLVMALQSLPSICWMPFALVWVGINEQAILLVIVLGALFAIAITTEGAIRNVPPIYTKVGRVLGAKRLSLSRDILFFAALPELLGGLKVGWTFAWRALMAAELLRADVAGVGAQLQVGRDFNDMAMMFASVLVILGIGLTVDLLGFGTLERIVRKRYGLEK